MSDLKEAASSTAQPPAAAATQTVPSNFPLTAPVKLWGMFVKTSSFSGCSGRTMM